MKQQKTTRVRRSHEDRIAELEQKIAAIKSKAERQKVTKNPVLRHVRAAVKAIDKAMESSEDKASREAMNEARSGLAAILTLNGAAPAQSNGTLVPQPRGRRSSADLGNLSERLLDYVIQNPGQRGEQIAKDLGTDTKVMRLPMRKLIDDGKVKTKGERRGMTYTAT